MKTPALEIEQNGDPITYLKEYAAIIGMLHPTLYRYCHDDKSKSQLIGTGVEKNITLLNVDDIYFMGNVMVWSDRGNNGMIREEYMG